MTIINRLVLAFGILAASSVQAAQIYFPATTGVVGSLYTDFSTFADYDVRGAHTAFIAGPTAVITADAQLGQDPTFQTMAFGNFAFSVYTPTLSDIAFMVFDATNAAVNGNVLTLDVTITDSTNTTNVLSPLFGTYKADFSLIGSTQFGAGSLVQYELASIYSQEQGSPVPEPGTIMLVGALLPVAFLVHRRRAQR